MDICRRNLVAIKAISGEPTSQTPHRCLFTPPSLLFWSIWSEKKVSKIRLTSLVVVALVGPLLSFSILVGWRMACLLAALLRGEKQNSIRNKYKTLNFFYKSHEQPSENRAMHVIWWRSQYTEWIDSLSRLGDSLFKVYFKDHLWRSALFFFFLSRTRTFSSFRGIVSPNRKLVNSNNEQINICYAEPC